MRSSAALKSLRIVLACVVAGAGLASFLAGVAPAAAPAVPDYNHDGTVDSSDLLMLQAAESSGDPSRDLDGDGKYTPRDLFLFSFWWGASPATPSPTPLPEIVISLPGMPADATPLVMVRIPAGSFMMGRYPGEPDSYSNEEPQHRVDIAYQSYLGKYEITKAQWQAVMGTTPWHGQDDVLDDPNSPAVFVSWNDIRGAGGFLAKLNALGQGTFRLPSEAEWEYACRATTTTRFYWGNDSNYSQIGRYAWYAGQQYAHVVGLKLPNAWGLFDMSGNVWEWCEDWWHVYYQGAPADGSAWIAGGTGNPVIRGGAWSNVAGSCRSASRYYYFADVRHDEFGFRVVRTP